MKPVDKVERHFFIGFFSLTIREQITSELRRCLKKVIERTKNEEHHMHSVQRSARD